MKHISILFLILLIPFSLLSGTRAEIVKKDGLTLTINKGSKDGVKADMRGVVQKRVQGEPINIGTFVVIRIEEDISELYVVKPANPEAKIEIAVQVEFDKTLIPPGKIIEKLKRNIQNCLKNKNYKRADQLIKEVLNKEPGDEEMKKLAKGINLLLSSVFPIVEYFNYKAIHSGSPILGDLKERVYKNYLNLPSEYYFDRAVNIEKNSNGYYEIEFNNSHTMIYVPERKLFVDKYEVSNFQYLKFAGENDIEIIPIHFSTLKGYPRNCLDYPAIVTYDEAEAYCSANGLRLPTEEEWEIIAGKDKGYKYSWGNLEIDDSDKYRSNFESLEDGYIEVAPVKSFKDYPSPLGVVNIMGNVYEWVKGKICKGGGYMSEKEQLTFEFRSGNCLRIGFRCVMDEIK